MAIIGRFPGVLSRHGVSWLTASLRSLLSNVGEKKKEEKLLPPRSRGAAVGRPRSGRRAAVAWRADRFAALAPLYEVRRKGKRENFRLR